MYRKKIFKRIESGKPSALASDGSNEHPSPTADSKKYTKVILKATSIGDKHVFDFAQWYKVGFDMITSACQEQIERFLNNQDKTLEATTVLRYCQSLSSFLKYLVLYRSSFERDLNVDDINGKMLRGFLQSLETSGTSKYTQKGNYAGVKSVLQAMCRRGLIREIEGGDDATFPPNPFSGAGRATKGQVPLTPAERMAFNRAIKQAIAPLFAEGAEPTSYLLACALLVVALHTGRNTWPLLEMTPDCLRPHPKNNKVFLVVYKRRGHSTNKVALLKARQADDNGLESVPSILPTVANLIQRIISLSRGLSSEAPEHLRDRIWLYRAQTARRGAGMIGSVTALSEDSLETAIVKLVRTYNLTDSDGKPLKLNVSRLRKTFINRVYEILDGDIVATASAAGNTVKTVDLYYLSPNEQSKRNWKFLGETLFEEALTGTLGSTERTPVGRCSDNRNGEYAPKQNATAICMNFLNCLRCRNYVVTGDDLYRVFSFYWRIFYERNRMRPKQWKRELGHITRLIDQDVIATGIAKGIFKKAFVDAERERARRAPHPFWSTETIMADISGHNNE